MRTANSVLALLLWVGTCGAVFGVVDGMATGPVEIYVEDFRQPGATDEDALMGALLEARRRGDHWWWIHDGRPVILLDEQRAYDFDPHLLRHVEVPVLRDRERGPIRLIRAIPAIRLP